MQIGIAVEPWWYPLAVGILFLVVGVYTFFRTHVTGNRILALLLSVAGALFTCIGLVSAHTHFRPK